MNNNRLTIKINKPVSEVFAFCITPPYAKLWIENITDEKTNEWPAQVGTVYTEFTKDSSFKIIVTDFKENDFVEWKTEDNNYHVRYMFTPIDQNSTQLVYHEFGEVEDPFTQEVLEKLKEVLENS